MVDKCSQVKLKWLVKVRSVVHNFQYFIGIASYHGLLCTANYLFFSLVSLGQHLINSQVTFTVYCLFFYFRLSYPMLAHVTVMVDK